MGKFNISHFDCKELCGVTHAYCDIQSTDCVAIEVPSVVTQFLLRKKNSSGKTVEQTHINVCNNCKKYLTLPDC